MRTVSIAQTGIDMAQIEQEFQALRAKMVDERTAESAAWQQVKEALEGIRMEIAGLEGDIERIKAEAEARSMANLVKLDAMIGTDISPKAEAFLMNGLPGSVGPQPARKNCVA